MLGLFFPPLPLIFEGNNYNSVIITGCVLAKELSFSFWVSISSLSSHGEGAEEV